MKHRPRHWLGHDPPWLEALYSVPLQSLEWLNETTGREHGARMASAVATGHTKGYPLTPTLLEACSDTDPVALAQFPTEWDRRKLTPRRATIWFDTARPETAWFAFDAEVPPVFWIPVTAENLDAVVESYVGMPWTHELNLERQVRFFLGTTRELGLEFDDLVDTIARFASVDPHPWGTAHLYDPWDEPQTMSLIMAQHLMREFGAQRPDAFPAQSMRTLASKSVLTVRVINKFITLDVRYRAASSDTAISPALSEFERVDAKLPLDVIATLAGFPLMILGDELREACEGRLEDDWQYDALAYAAYYYDNTQKLDWLFHEHLTTSLAERHLASKLADVLNRVGDLLRMLRSETDNALRQRLVGLTSTGGAA